MVKREYKCMPLLALLVVLFWSSVTLAQTPTPSTFNPVPANDASFFSVLRTFLLGEDADRYAVQFNPMRFQGCAHGTAAGMTGTFVSTCKAFVAGSLIEEPAASINYTTQGATAADFCWVLLGEDTTTAIPGFTRVAGTHYLTDCTSPNTSRPVLTTTAAMYVMGVTISGSAITAVTQLFNHWPWITTYTSVAEIANTLKGQFGLSDAGVLCYTNGSSCVGVAAGDASGCATCGDSAASFFNAGQLAPLRGGTGDDTSAETGVPVITAGDWTYPNQLPASLGGTGNDFSGSTGVVTFQAGAGSVEAFPLIERDFNAFDLGVDATQCTRGTAVTIVSGVTKNVITCADNSAGVFTASMRLPATYDASSAMTLRLTGANAGSTAGASGFDVTCMCDTSGGTMSAANFASAVNVDFTWSGTTGQMLVTSAAITCGGTCSPGDILTIRGTVDTTATTHAAPTEIKFFLLNVTATTDTL